MNNKPRYQMDYIPSRYIQSVPNLQPKRGVALPCSICFLERLTYRQMIICIEKIYGGSVCC